MTLSATDLANMRATQNASMADTCVILTYGVGALDEYGHARPAYLPGAAIACGMNHLRGLVQMGEAMHDVGLFKTVIRLPITTTVTVKDRIRVTHRHGTDIADVTYEIVGEPTRGPTAITIEVRKVTDGS